MDDRNEEWDDIKELKAELAGMTEDRNAVTRQRNEALRRVDEYVALDAGMGASLLKAQNRIRELEAENATMAQWTSPELKASQVRIAALVAALRLHREYAINSGLKEGHLRQLIIRSGDAALEFNSETEALPMKLHIEKDWLHGIGDEEVSPLAGPLPELPEADEGPPTLGLNGYQIHRLWDFVDAEPEAEVTLGNFPERADMEDGTKMPAGLYAWFTDYPDEGSIWLPETPDDHMADVEPSTAKIKGNET